MHALARAALTLALIPVWILFACFLAFFAAYCAACDPRDETER